MSVYDEIFPSERRLEYVQTQWSEGWHAGASGFGFAAAFLTKNARSFGATIDQAGLAVFYLQRHRTELILKAMLEVLGEDFPRTHSLKRIWDLCETALSAVPGLEWDRFAVDHGEFVMVLAQVDDGSATFRFPVDRSGARSKRPAFIDLEALNRHADDLFWAATGCMDFYLESAEAERVETDFADSEMPPDH